MDAVFHLMMEFHSIALALEIDRDLSSILSEIQWFLTPDRTMLHTIVPAFCRVEHIAF